MKQRKVIILLVIFLAANIASVHAALSPQRLLGGCLKEKCLVEEVQTIKGVDVYDIKVLSQKISDLSPNLREFFGCGFFALNNLLFISRMLLSQQVSQLDCDALGSREVFLYYFDGKEAGNEKLPWSTVWTASRIERGVKFKLIDDPPTLPEDLENLKKTIIDQKALAPEQSPIILQNTTIIRLQRASKCKLNDNYLRDKFLDTDEMGILQELSKKFKENKSIIIPVLIAYTYRSSGDLGGHWIAVVISKFEDKIEVFFADPWRKYAKKNFDAAELLIDKIVN